MRIDDCDIEAYHASNVLSHSKLKDFADLGPKGFYLRHVKRADPRPDTKALRAGRAFETYFFERAEFEAWFAVKPEAHNGRTNKGKDWVTEQEMSGKTILDRDDFAAFEHMSAAIRECASAMALLEQGFYQPTYRVKWAGTPGLQSRPDWCNEEGCARSDFRPYTLDFKTTRNLNDITTGRGVVKYGYHTQAAVARTAAEIPDCVSYLLVAEKAFPCRVVVVELDRMFVNIGEDWTYRTMTQIAEHYSADHWPLTTEDSVVVGPPAYLLAEHDAQQANDQDDADEDAA